MTSLLSLTTVSYLLTLLTLSLFLYNRITTYKFNLKYKLPPRLPGAIPIFGNTFQLPPLKQGVWAMQMARQHGEMFTARIGGSTWVFLNSSRVVNDILEKRSLITSSRPPFPFASTILSHDSRIVLMPYTARWRTIRKIMHTALNKSTMPIFAPFQDVESRHLLYDFLKEPEEWWLASQRFANSVIMSVVFGTRMNATNPDVKELFETSSELINALQPGANLVDAFPVLDQIIPQKLQWWRKRGERLHMRTVSVYKRQVEALKGRMERGVQRDCFATRFLKEPSTREYGETQTYFALGSLMEAGSDTSRMTISQVMAAAAMDGRWVRTAREWLDRVCGSVGDGEDGMRLPEFGDRERLTYITAAVKEGFRWRPFAEIGMPHMLTEDTEYEGYKFPQGTVFTWNSTAIALDEREYEDPERFWPERFMNDDVGNVLKGHWSFGPGRRVCSGYNVGETNVWIVVARLLYCFDFEQVKGKEIDSFKVDWGEHRWAPFEVKIKPRSEAHKHLIERECKGATEMEY